jgi:tetratricopeptide (TPR) repeat protein
MRTAILLSPPEATLDELPPCFSPPVGEPALREWLAHPTARRRLVAVLPHERFEHAAARALNLDRGNSDAVSVVYVAGCAQLSSADWEALGLERTLLTAQEAAEREVEDLIARAAKNFDGGAWEHAGNEYRAADERLATDCSARHAEVLVMLGEIERLQGRTQSARRLLDRALSMAPNHTSALRVSASIARATDDHATCAAMLQRLLETATDASDKKKIAALVVREALEAARQGVAKGLELDPGDPDLLRRRRAIAEIAENWEDAVNVEVQLAVALRDPKDRAAALASAAALCRDKAKNLPRAVALYEAALADDPGAAGAFEAVELILQQGEDWRGLAKAYGRQLDRLPADADVAQRASLMKKLALNARDRLGDAASAVRVLEDALALTPGDVETCELLVELLEWLDRPSVAIKCIESVTAHAPFHAELYRRARRLFIRTGEEDRALAACAALVTLGEADLDEQLGYAQLAPEGPLRFSRSFDAHVWAELLPEGHDTNLDALASALEPAAIAGWMDHREAQGAKLLPDSRLRQDPETATATAVKSFAWCARALGLPAPAIYAQPDNARIGAATVPGRTPGVLLGRPVLSGRTSVELSFIAAHHLAYVRPGWRLLAYYPKLDQLEGLMRAALSIARSDAVPPPSLTAQARGFRELLDRHLDADGRRCIGEASERMAGQGFAIDLEGWTRTIEIAACRAALVVTGDVSVAVKLLGSSGGVVAGLTARDRGRDLLPFSISARYAGLRRLLGVAATK